MLGAGSTTGFGSTWADRGPRYYPYGNPADEEFYFWSPQGQRLGTYKSTSPGVNAFTAASTNVYFGGRLIQRSRPIAVYNSGATSSGALAPDGAVDTHYTLINSADTAFPGPSVLAGVY